MSLLAWISPLSLSIGLLGAVKNRQFLTSLEKTIAFFLLIFVLIDFCSRYIVEWFGLTSNLTILSIYVLIEYLFISILYTRFFPTRKSKFLLYSAILGGLVILIFSLSKVAPIITLQFQMYEGLFANLFSLLFGLFFIYKIMIDEVESTKQQRSLNNIIIMYAGIQFFMALTINFMVNMEVELVFFFWLIRLIALTIFYLKLSQIIWQTGKKVAR